MSDYHPGIVELSDEGLVRATILVTEHRLFEDLTANDWERSFLEDMVELWRRYGSISWKQRRVLRRVLSKLTKELERRRAVSMWIDEVHNR